jgi:hypothetical protein
MTKTCPKCGASSWGTRGRCKPCHARRSRERYAANLEAERARLALAKRRWRAAHPDLERADRRARRYGISGEAFDALVRSQGGVCAICRRPEPNCVDHHHATGRIRGILCAACNAGLGLLREDETILRAAADYLLKPQ